MPASGRPWNRERAKYKAECKAANAKCWIDGCTIDYNAAPNTPQSFVVDHVHPTSLGGDPMRRSNWKPAAFGCNSRRGNTTRGQYPTSRAW